MVNISKRNDGEKRFAEYFLQNNDRIDSLTLGMLVNNNIEGINPVTPVKVGSDKLFKYDITKYITMKEYFGESVKKEKLLRVFYGIAISMKLATDYMINWTSFVLDEDNIFVVKETGETRIICIPLLQVINDGNTCNFFKNVLFTAQLDEEENNDYVGKLLALLNPKTYTIEKFIYEIEEMMGIEHRVFETYNEDDDEEDVVEQEKTEEVTETQTVVLKAAEVSEAVKEEITEAKEVAPNAEEVKETVAEVKGEVREAKEVKEPVTEVKDEVKEAVQEAKKVKEPVTEVKEETKEAEEIKEAVTEVKPESPKTMGIKETLKKTVAEVMAKASKTAEVKEAVTEVKAEAPKAEEVKEAVTEVKEEAPKAEEAEEVKEATIETVKEVVVEAKAEAEKVEKVAQTVKEEVTETKEETEKVQEVTEETKDVTEETKKDEFFEVEFKDDDATDQSTARQTRNNETSGKPEQEADKNFPFLYSKKRNEKVFIKKEKFIIGSDKASSDYYIKGNPNVEPNHAFIIQKDNEYYLSDNDTIEGTVLDHLALFNDEEMLLRNGMQIEIAGEILEFRVKE